MLAVLLVYTMEIVNIVLANVSIKEILMAMAEPLKQWELVVF